MTSTHQHRILLTCFSPSWGGLEMQALQLASGLAARGHKMTLGCVPNSTLEKEARDSGLPVLPGDARHPLNSILRFSRWFSHNTTDIVHTYLSRDLWLLVPALALSGKSAPLILTKQMGSGVVKKDPLHRMLYRRTSLVTAISAHVERNVLETCPISPEKVARIPNGILIDRYRRSIEDGQAIRQEFGIPADALVIGNTARFSIGKGQMELIQALALLRKETPTAHLLFVGSASHGEESFERELRALVLQLGLEDYVHYAGFRTDVPRLMSAMDIFAFPSYDEAFGVALVEAMAMELPVVASNNGGIPDIAIEEVTALLIPPRTVEPLRDALAALAANPALRQSMGQAGRERAVGLFSMDRVYEMVEFQYARLLSGPAPV